MGGSIDSVLDRLADVLPSRAPTVWQDLRAPVDDSELEALRTTVAPYRLPDDVVALLHWADGQRRQWWPSTGGGPLLSASEMARQYEWLNGTPDVGTWTPLLLPIASEGWSLLVVEMTDDRPGVVVDANAGDHEFHVPFPSVASFLDAAADMAEADLLTEPSPPPGPLYAEYSRRVRAVATACGDRHGWGHWSHPRSFSRDPLAWPAEWLAAAGRSLEGIRPRGATHTLAELLDERPERATVAGRVVGLAGGRDLVVTVEDGTGRLDVWCPQQVQAWGPVRKRRFEFDVTFDSPLSAEPMPDSAAVQRHALDGDIHEAVQAAGDYVQRLERHRPDVTATAIRPLDQNELRP